MDKVTFEWDPIKNEANIVKHGISFFDAQRAFLDSNRIVAEDVAHSRIEIRYYCFGRVDGAIMTVRFIYRNEKIRIFWRRILEKREGNL